MIDNELSANSKNKEGHFGPRQEEQHPLKLRTEQRILKTMAQDPAKLSNKFWHLLVPLKRTSHSSCQYTSIPVIKMAFPPFFKWQKIFHPMSVKWSPRHVNLPKPHLSSLSNYSMIWTGMEFVKKKKKKIKINWGLNLSLLWGRQASHQWV